MVSFIENGVNGGNGAMSNTQNTTIKTEPNLTNLSFIEKGKINKCFQLGLPYNQLRVTSIDKTLQFGKPSKETQILNEKKAKNKIKEVAPSPAKQAAMKNIFSSSVFDTGSSTKKDIKKPKIRIYLFNFSIIEVKTDNFCFNNDGKVEDAVKYHTGPRFKDDVSILIIA